MTSLDINALNFGSYNFYWDSGFGSINMTPIIISLVSLFILIFASLKAFFGTYSILQIIDDFKVKKKISSRYNELFSAREGLQFHISWAKSRGDHDEAKSMIRDLIQVDKEIDALELSFQTQFGDRKTKEKLLSINGDKNI